MFKRIKQPPTMKDLEYIHRLETVSILTEMLLKGEVTKEEKIDAVKEKILEHIDRAKDLI